MTRSATLPSAARRSTSACRMRMAWPSSPGVTGTTTENPRLSARREPGRSRRVIPASMATPSFGGERHPEHALLELAELVARLRRLLELQVLRVLEHLLLQRPDLARDLLLRHRLVPRLFLCEFRF